MEVMIMEYKFTAENFETEVLKSEIPVLVDFFATWCGPCKMMSPVIAELAEEYDGKVKVGKIDTDENPEIAAQFGVMSIPNFVIIKDGKVAANVVGAVPKTVLAGKLDEVL